MTVKEEADIPQKNFHNNNIVRYGGWIQYRGWYQWVDPSTVRSQNKEQIPSLIIFPSHFPESNECARNFTWIQSKEKTLK